MATKKDLPSFEKYFAPAVEALKKRGGSATIEEMEEDVASLMGLSDDILAVQHKDGSRSQFSYELTWVRTYLKKAGLAQNSERGVVLDRRRRTNLTRQLSRGPEEGSVDAKAQR